MKKLLRLTFVTVVAALGTTMSISAQGYYDDDIYYDASKAKKEQKQKIEQAAKQAARKNYVPSQPITNYPAADSYSYHNNSTRDVDEYNRRYNGRETTDSISLDQLLNGDFTYTERIERFSNPEIVTGSGDPDLQYYYYNTESQPSTTIVINNVDPWGYNSFYNPWYYDSWYSPYYSPYAWNYGWGYNPWYGSAWGPSWSIGWGPSWSWGPSWGWGPSWSWGWGGGWHPGGHGPIWSGNNWRPSSPGASRPNVEGGLRPTTPGRRPGSNAAASAVYNGANHGYRPAVVAGNQNGNHNGTVNTNAGRRPSTIGTTSGNRGISGTTIYQNNSGRQGRSASTPSYNTNTNTRPSNNNNSSWSSGSRQSSGSSFGGSRGSFGGGSTGGGRSTGGGGGRSGRH